MNTKFQKVGLVLMSLGLLNACGGKGETSGSAGVTQSSIIIGDLDWSEVEDHGAVAARGGGQVKGGHRFRGEARVEAVIT